MEKNDQVYETIRELILLGFFIRKNFDIYQINLGEYQYGDKKYQIHSSWGENETSIFIKCGNESIHLIIEDDEKSRRFGGPITNDVYFHLNKYKDIDDKDIVYYYPLYGLDRINIEKVIYESKIKLDYSRSLYMYDNPNGLGPHGWKNLKGKKFIFNRPESFDKKIKNEKCIELFKDEFSPEIILNIIEQIYPNFEQININNKIDRIIDSLSQEELLFLKERLQEREQQLVRKLI